VCFVDLRGVKLFPQEVVEAHVSTVLDLLERARLQDLIDAPPWRI
jgi:hypothetical protein